MSPSFCTTVERSMPVREKILIMPSSPAVRRPVPSALHRHDVIAPLCAVTLRSTRAPLLRITKRPSADEISKFSLLRPPLDFAISQLKSVGVKSGIFATCTKSRLVVVHLTIWQSSLEDFFANYFMFSWKVDLKNSSLTRTSRLHCWSSSQHRWWSSCRAILCLNKF